MLDTRSIEKVVGAFVVAVALFFCVSDAMAQNSPAPWAESQQVSRPEDLSIRLITFGPGDGIPEWFGHTALWVHDDRLNYGRIYNFGMFDFGPDMLPKFLMGRLEFWVGEASVKGTLALYERLNRDIRVQELNLPPERREEMAQFLAWNVQPENRDYLYDHYYDNCATRIRDAIDKSFDGQFHEQTKETGRYTLRGHVRRHSQHVPYIDFVLMLWMNEKIDAPITEWEEMFLPAELETRLGEGTWRAPDGSERPMVKKSWTIYESEREPTPAEPSNFWLFMLLCGAAIAAGGSGLAAWRQYAAPARLPRVLFGLHHVITGLALGLPGLILPLFHFTEHTITHYNVNILLTNPLMTLAFPLGIGIIFGSKRAWRWMGWAWMGLAVTSVLALIVAPFVTQSNGLLLALFVPLNIGMAFVFRKWEPPTKGEKAEDAGSSNDDDDA